MLINGILSDGSLSGGIVCRGSKPAMVIYYPSADSEFRESDIRIYQITSFIVFCVGQPNWDLHRLEVSRDERRFARERGNW